MKLSVITVTYNNAAGLDDTLKSLSVLKNKPYEVIIIDGASKDNTPTIVDKYRHYLNIIFISEKDKGIYDAMNKGKHLAKGELLHYLNAGDCVSGEVYDSLAQPCLLNVRLFENKLLLGECSLSHSGTSYCHQGIIFPREHPDYNLTYRLCADYNLISTLYPYGLDLLPRLGEGYIIYDMSGVSANKRLRRDLELASIMYNNNKTIFYKALPVFIIKLFFPKILRRTIRKFLFKLSSKFKVDRRNV